MKRTLGWSLLLVAWASTSSAEEWLPAELQSQVVQEGAILRSVSITAEDSVSLTQWLGQKVLAAGDVGTLGLYRVPGQPDLILVSAAKDRKETKTDFGRRFYLVSRGVGTDWVLLGRSQGMRDSYCLDPVAFFSGDRVLVLGETATEGFWGFALFEIKARKLKFIGVLDAVTLDAEQNTVSPAAGMRVQARKGAYYFSFPCDLVLDPDTAQEKHLKRKGEEPIVLRFDPRSKHLQRSAWPGERSDPNANK